MYLKGSANQNYFWLENVMIHTLTGHFAQNFWTSPTSSTSLKVTLYCYIPPYTPELNPIELQWRMIKKATANMLYESPDAMKDSVCRTLGSGEIGVAAEAKLSEYLR